jgi:hypothetical protein
MGVENWIDPLTHVVDGLAQRDLGWIGGCPGRCGISVAVRV